MGDLHTLFHNLLRNSQNRDIECALLRRQLGMLTQALSQPQIDIGSLVKGNM